MDLENIKDVEILRSKLKEFMIKCKKDYQYKDFKIYNGEWYYVNQDEGGIWLSDDNKHIHVFDDEEMGELFEIPLERR